MCSPSDGLNILSLLMQVKVAHTSRSLGIVFPTPYLGCLFVCCMAGFCCVVQTGLELTVILWLQPLKYQDYRHKLSYLLELGATVSTSYGRLVLTEPLLSSELPSLSRSMLSKVAMTYEQLTAARSCYQVLHCTINN